MEALSTRVEELQVQLPSPDEMAKKEALLKENAELKKRLEHLNTVFNAFDEAESTRKEAALQELRMEEEKAQEMIKAKYVRKHLEL